MRSEFLLVLFGRCMALTLVFRGKRIRLKWGVQRALASQQNLALAASSLLAPCALVAFTLTCWSMAAEMRWTAGFFVVRGVFSHWQSWLVASLVLFCLARLLTGAVDEGNS